MAGCLTDYVTQFALPVELGSRWRSIRQREGRYLVEFADRTDSASQVVIATGPFQVPFVPSLAGGLAEEVAQLHSTAYRALRRPPASVLVVGGGNTGFQIAQELSGPGGSDPRELSPSALDALLEPLKGALV